jgi:xanthine dehydrogenase accessory factor
VDIYEEILKLRSEGRISSLATIVQCNGSTPQKIGAKMLVRDDGSICGTIGGGSLEAEVIKSALMVMNEGIPRTVPFELTENLGKLVCGGKVLVYIEPVMAAPHLIILGAGHVGKALATIGKFLRFQVTVVDDRQEYANKENIPSADNLVIVEFQNAFSKVTVEKGSYIVIATRGHNHDFDALRAALRTDAEYIALLGSARKKSLVLKTLETEGFSQHDISRVVTPAGLPIGSVSPEEIAISIMAQIIQMRSVK